MITSIDDSYKHRHNNENFIYDSETDSYTCPKGNKLNIAPSKSDKKIYKCKDYGECPAKSECAKKSNYRQVI